MSAAQPAAVVVPPLPLAAVVVPPLPPAAVVAPETARVGPAPLCWSEGSDLLRR
ncbi:hypothetical protein N2K95_14345 [Arthrobacter zhaoxinii]|uniref:Secreted protein n=1 Tax=Arthrobacter zhaoxinii TaxID=2964616 RepID=A0ABY5YNY5_9MICC|nr:hypothetical protein [Arthrobacter zhaoxinii]UWX96802.1 hypothetical protein N2K95_14345 [Arthrobacter zhaoxinii]